MPSKHLIQAIAATAEICGKVFTPAAAQLFASDLDGYDEKSVLRALTRCRKDLKGPFTLESVLSRIDDGRPGTETAWAMVASALADERVTMVITSEMMQAFFLASNLQDDPIAARMAFKEAYAKGLVDARSSGVPVKWQAVLGHDASGREAPLMEAVEKGRLSAARVIGLLPYSEGSAARARLDYLRQENELLTLDIGAA